MTTRNSIGESSVAPGLKIELGLAGDSGTPSAKPVGSEQYLRQQWMVTPVATVRARSPHQLLELQWSRLPNQVLDRTANSVGPDGSKARPPVGTCQGQPKRTAGFPQPLFGTGYLYRTAVWSDAVGKPDLCVPTQTHNALRRSFLDARSGCPWGTNDGGTGLEWRREGGGRDTPQPYLE